MNFCEKSWLFETIVHYYWKWISYWKTCLFSENFDFLCECLYTLRNCQNMIKTSIFLRKCLFVHVLIFIRVFLLLENCYFDSKYDFIRWYFGKSVIFLVKFTFQVAYIFWKNRTIFLRKGVNLAVHFGKITIGIRSNLVVSLKKKMTIRFISIFSLSVFHWYKRKSCRNSNIEGYFHFSSKWSLFSKIIVSSGHSKFS